MTSEKNSPNGFTLSDRKLSQFSEATTVGNNNSNISKGRALEDYASTDATLKTPQPYTLIPEECAKSFDTSLQQGLTTAEAQSRLAKYGENSLSTESGVSISKVIISQVFNAMVLVLIISMAISFGIRDFIAGGVIAGVIAINIGIGTLQEYNAEKTMESLKGLSSPTARVIRNGEDVTIPSVELVPGDLVVVKVGETVPADCRIITSMNLETDEALLTGESLPILKDPDAIFDINEDVPVGDRANMIFSSSVISKGRATAIATSTGMQTEIGIIAESLKGKKKAVREVKRDENGNARKRDYASAIAGTFNDAVGAFLGTTTGTPLQQTLAKLAIFLFGVAVVFAIVVMAAQKFKVNREVAVYAICVALSMIPASLVVVLTITMAAGAKVMVKRNVIIRKLDSLEALGAVNDICSDKTGTLTQGKMITKKVWIPTVGTYSVSDTQEPFNPEIGKISLVPLDPSNEFHKLREIDDKFLPETRFIDPTQTDIHSEYFQRWLYTASLANIANVFYDDKESSWKANGDPTEIAIQVFAHRLNYQRSNFTDRANASFSHLAEYPFDSTVKRMTAVYKAAESGDIQVFTKGAVERVLECCDSWYGLPAARSEVPVPIDDNCQALVHENMEALAKQGLRVLAFAQKSIPSSMDTNWSSTERGNVEKNLTFLGLVGIYDPPRAESAGAVKKCHKAGINVHMLTGDHPGTARAIAQEVGILPHNLYHYSEDIVKIMVMTASEFDALDDDQIDALPVLPLVIARCAPTTKVRMIDALHRREKFAAMTGDGVNDSPSLKRADVGIAMGIAGSDVAKDASDIVLSDDNFASILNAVEEGRRMSDNIHKFALHLLAGNVSQALYLLLGLVFIDNSGFSVFPLSPVEVLWIIMITSSFPAMGLGQERAQPDIMQRPPKDPKKGIFTWEVIIDMCMYGLILAVICIATFVGIVYGDGNGDLGYDCNKEYNDACHFVFRARSTTFVQMTWCLLVLAWEVIDMRRSLFAMHPETDTPYTQVFRDLWSNQFLFWSVVGGFVVTFPVIYIPVINTKVFLHSPITWEWALGFAGLFVFIACVELYKWVKRITIRHFLKKNEVVLNPEHQLERNSPFAKYASFSRQNTMEV
ncbi:P-type ATPase sodium pump [Nadsonia fulvescens var. elongata DSM 6958]|uniref:P-type Na(+) transporter n=1 Tax=Nadsonia fulvescens var. elongata DSM 6958 TaxID=857566 RepID=A0A1E3PDB7_9ASCO|nr:P-type ATPase sodium pump [Nadsonia fulvescens var. elongata DSM 6958]